MKADDIWLMTPEAYSEFLRSVRDETKARFPDATEKEIRQLEMRVVLREKMCEGSKS